ncbi:MAG: helix-hairpin-helix domain-containing protein, partial [Desulfococcaceae bacterium]
MPVKNGDVAEIFEEMADLLEIDQANAFRVRAYRDAARLIDGMGDRVADRVEKGDDLTRLTGIGDDLAGKIREIVETGKLSELEAVRERVPPSLRELMQIEGLGAKKVRSLWKSLHITDLKGLLWAAETEKIREVSGFGKRTEEKILEAAKELEGGERRFLRPKAEEVGEPLLDYLRNLSGVRTADIAGSYRRGKETVGDLDVLIIRDEGAEVMKSFVEYQDVERIVSQGDTRSTVVLRGGMHVDLRVVAPESYGAALHYFTGSKAHNVSLRRRANGKGLKINEYGVFRDDERVAGETESEVYATVDLPFIPPELREDRGEIDAALNGTLPELLTLDDIRGDLHCHTDETDGRAGMKEMVEAARKRGYGFLAISDHTQNVTVANGMD